LLDAHPAEPPHPTGIEVTDAELAALPLSGHDWHPESNYDLSAKKNPDRHK